MCSREVLFNRVLVESSEDDGGGGSGKAHGFGDNNAMRSEIQKYRYCRSYIATRRDILTFSISLT